MKFNVFSYFAKLSLKKHCKINDFLLINVILVVNQKKKKTFLKFFDFLYQFFFKNNIF